MEITDKTKVPSARIQHQGSSLCMDIHCECGGMHHIDSDFCFHIRTPCGRIYSVGETLTLTIEVEGNQPCIQDCDQ